jgi:hypothetical protein
MYHVVHQMQQKTRIFRCPILVKSRPKLVPQIPQNKDSPKASQTCPNQDSRDVPRDTQNDAPKHHNFGSSQIARILGCPLSVQFSANRVPKDVPKTAQSMSQNMPDVPKHVLKKVPTMSQPCPNWSQPFPTMSRNEIFGICLGRLWDIILYTNEGRGCVCP